MRRIGWGVALSVIVLAAGLRVTRAQEEAPPPLEPPKLNGGAERFEAAFTVEITAAGEIMMDGATVDWSALESALCARKRPKGMIRVKADRRAPWAVVRDVSFMIGEAPGRPSPLWAVTTKDGAIGWHQPIIPGSMHKLRKAFLVRAMPAEGGIDVICPDGSLGILPETGKSKEIRSALTEFHEWEPEQPAKISGGPDATFGQVAAVVALVARSGYTGILYVRETLPLEIPPERPMEGTLGRLRTTAEIRESLELPEVSTATAKIDSLVGEVEVIVTKSREILVDGTRSDRDFLVRFIGDQAAPRPEDGGRITRGGQELSKIRIRILADRNAHWRDIQEVLDSCREVGAHRVYFTVLSRGGPALLPAFLNLEDTRAKDRAAKPIRFTVRLRRSRGQERTFVGFSEI